MKKIYAISITLMLIGFLPVSGVAQNTNLNVKWKAKPLDNKIFIENKGQFDAEVKNEKIAHVLFYVKLGGDIKAYFTANGVLYRQIKYVLKDNDNGEKNDPDAPHAAIEHKVGLLWEGSNPNATIEAGEKQTYFESYGTLDNQTIKANVFKKITYRNLYPGIDVEYIFPGEGKEGIKYTVIVHPGADLSQVKLSYSGANSLHIDATGNVLVENEISEFTDHAPIGSVDGTPVDVEYAINGTEESFAVKNYDRTKTLVIDPWTTTTLGFTYNVGYDIDYDYAGNVYVAGGYNPYQIAKFNSSGVYQWVYNCFTADTTALDLTYWGDFVVARDSGIVYVLEGYNNKGAWAEKVSTNGTFTARYIGNTNLTEMWRAEFNERNNEIDIGGGGTNSGNNQVAVLDETMTTLTPQNTLAVTNGGHDVCLMALDPISNTCYIAVVQSSFETTVYNNYLFSVPLPALIPPLIAVSDGYSFQEATSISYVGTGSGCANAMNGMAASPNWLYIYDGATLKQLHNNDLAINNSKAGLGTAYAHGGLAADAYDNVYVGVGDSIVIYNASLTRIAAVKSPNTIYDIVTGVNDTCLYACGKGFVEELNNPISIATGINNISNLITTTVYPDPATNTLNLSFDKKVAESFMVIKIIDVTGKEVFSTIANSQQLIANSQFTIDVSALARGMYFVKIITGTSQQVVKFVKM